jgi:DnaK suppressor protein
MSTKKKAKKKAVAKKTAVKKTAVKKTATKKAPATKKTAAKKTPAKRPAAAKSAPAPKKKAPVSKAPVHKAASAKANKSKGRDFTDFIPYEEKHGEDYMNDPQQEHFREILRHWKQELMEEVDRTVHHMQDEAANFPDPNDRATQESEFTMELRTRDRERKLIKKIDEALEKIDNGEYGYCEECGIEIGVRRLEARPTAALCIDCKSLDEIREKQRY